MCEDIDAEGDPTTYETSMRIANQWVQKTKRGSKGNTEKYNDMWPRCSHSEKALTTMKPSQLS